MDRGGNFDTDIGKLCAPVARVAVAPSKRALGINASGRVVPEAYEVLELTEALTRTYATDAHLVTYVVPGAVRQSRINAEGLAFAPAIPEIGVFFCDVDNADHAEWTDSTMEKARAEDDAMALLANAGIYYTSHGRRIVQPIATPIPATEVGPYVSRWVRELEMAGIAVDSAPQHWTQHFRLPHVRRAGNPFRSPHVGLERMTPIVLAPLVAAAIDWTREVPPSWSSRIAPIADAVRGVTSELDSLFDALAGGLLARRVAPEHVPVLCHAIAIGADARASDREAAARRIVERKLAGKHVVGFADLRRLDPTVADAIDRVLASGADARVRALAREAAACVVAPLAETTAALDAAIRNAPDGLTLISAECGLGKTQSAIRVAIERASKSHVDPDALGARAPVQSKTAISVDKTLLAEQITKDLRRAGADVKRLFGPLSMRREDGAPECRYHDAATPLVEGGQSLQLLFCDGPRGSRCEHYESCRARRGIDGADDARIAVGPHALLSKLHADAGTTGLLVIDEPPALLETVALTLSQLDAALEARLMFDVRYAAAMTPSLKAMRAWASDVAEVDCAVEPADAVRGAAATLDSWDIAAACIAVRVTRTSDPVADAIACVRRAIPDSARCSAPPISSAYVNAARHSTALAEKLGTASKVLNALHFALTTDERIAVRVDERGGVRQLTFTHARADLANAVKRVGATVVLDANADLHAPVLETVVGYTPPSHRFQAGDGAPIKRTMIRTKSATRRMWLVRKRLIDDSGFFAILRGAIDWAASDPDAKSLGIVTFRPIAKALRLARDCPEGKLGAAADGVSAELQSTLAKWRGDLHIGHYGAVRGLDSMKDADCIVTLGDPWPNLGGVKQDVAFLGLAAPWEKRVVAMCRAELEQAHGRLRVVHRTSPARALHVGNVLPGGSGWAEGRIELRRLVGGRPPTKSTMAVADVVAAVALLGGYRASARAIDCSLGSILRYGNGECAAPEDIAAALRDVLARGVGERAAE